MTDQAAGNPDQAKPIATEDVLRAEAKAIYGLKLSETGPALYDALFKGRSAAALCLSGGGIRSAAFALGVIEALAVHPRPAWHDDPNKVDQARDVAGPEQSPAGEIPIPLTVSGGGYIGSWLSAWVTRAGFPTVWSNLTGRPKGPDIEPQRSRGCGPTATISRRSSASCRRIPGPPSRSVLHNLFSTGWSSFRCCAW